MAGIGGTGYSVSLFKIIAQILASKAISGDINFDLIDLNHFSHLSDLYMSPYPKYQEHHIDGPDGTSTNNAVWLWCQRKIQCLWKLPDYEGLQIIPILGASNEI